MRKTFATLVVLLAATSAYAADKRVHRTVSLDSNGRLSLRTHNGSVTITTWNQPKVDIDARIEAADSDYPEDVQKTEVRIDGSASNVRIESDYSGLGWQMSGWFRNNRQLPPVHYTISMPVGASLEIDNHNSDLRVTGLAGDANITSHNGSVDLRELQGGVEVNAHNASVRVAFNRFTKSTTIETHNGGVEVRLPSEARFNVNASGHHLGVDSDFPVVTRQMSGSTYVGNVNGGGPELRFSTHNGSLRLRRG